MPVECRETLNPQCTYTCLFPSMKKYGIFLFCLFLSLSASATTITTDAPVKIEQSVGQSTVTSEFAGFDGEINLDNDVSPDAAGVLKQGIEKFTNAHTTEVNYRTYTKRVETNLEWGRLIRNSIYGLVILAVIVFGAVLWIRKKFSPTSTQPPTPHEVVS